MNKKKEKILVIIYDPLDRPLIQRIKIALAILSGKTETFLKYCIGHRYEN